ncbi:MAG: tripartite tricarboxylate transporter substrate binding protein [Burkholderiales bacterium]|nr:tripartite tricarboxylate transporter substrate binding protein [Burkholderiales bacterium]
MNRQIASALSVLGLAAGAALAQGYPAKPVRVIVPFPPGGGVDTVARVVTQKFPESWGQQVIVENRPGAGGNIAADLVAKSAPDGYTVLITTTGHAVAPSLYRKLPFDAIKDFAAASQIISTYLVLVANPSMPATFKELLALMKSQPGKLNYAHTGLGVAPHLVGEMLRIATGANFVQIGYKGDAQTIPALLANEAQFAFTPPTTSVGHVRAGKLRALAVSGAARGSAFPDTPTIAEVGFRDATYNGFVGFFTAAGTPREILARIASETARSVRLPDVADKIPSWGGQAAGTGPEEFAALFRAEVERYGKLIRQVNIPLVD